MLSSLLIAIVAFATIVVGSSLDHAWSPPYYPSPLGGRVKSDDKWKESYERARDFVAQLTLLEKVNLTSGIGTEQGRCVGQTGEIPRFNMSGICFQDGPLGVRATDFVTGFPAGITAGSTFNKDLMYKRGAGIGQEFRGKGADVILGPATGPMGTKALGGRIWEAFGSDPYLQGVAGSLTVEGMQDQGVMANAKHFIANEQEHFRRVSEYRKYNFTDLESEISSNVDDRAMHEIYAWPFAEMIHSGVGSIMCSYNKINNSLGCQNSYLLNKIAKDELGFDGFVVSDWYGQKSGVAAVLAGLDVGMPGDDEGVPGFLGANLTTMVMNGTVPEWRLNDMAVRTMAAYYYVGLDKTREEIGGPNFYSWSLNTTDAVYHADPESSPYEVVNEHVDVQTDFSQEIAYKTAVEALVLLKNNNKTLPLNSKSQKIKKLSILGKAAAAAPVGPNCPSTQGCSDGVLAVGWGSGSIEFPFLSIPADEISRRARENHVSVDWNFGTTVSDQFDKTATTSDVNIVFALSDSGEGFQAVEDNLGDRNNASLWHNGDAIIKRAAEKNSNNIVVVTSVGPVNLERWIDHPNITAVLFTTPGGQYTGQAISDVIFGDYNPSGRLPFTIAKKDDDYVPIVKDVPEDGHPQDNFDEGIYIDYRLFDHLNKTPRYEFGYGLSYSNWEFSNIEVSPASDDLSQSLPAPPSLAQPYSIDSNLPEPSECVFPKDFHRVNDLYEYPWVKDQSKLTANGSYPYPEGYSTVQHDTSLPAGGGPGGNPALYKNVYKVKADLTNQGPYKGAYVGQLYLGFPQSDKYPSPPKQLRGFEKVELTPNETTCLEFDLRWKDLAIWDVYSQSWTIQSGCYKVYVGSSSRKLELVSLINI